MPNGRSSGTVARGIAVPEKEDVIQLARRARLMVRVAAFGLVLVFGWLKLHGVDLAPLAKDVTAELLFQVSLALYFLCWVAGPLSDIADQERVYLRPPTKRGQMPLGGWVTWILLTTVFGILCWVDSYKKFSICLFAFLFLNVVTWQYLVRGVLRSTVKRLEKEYRESEDYIGLEQLKLVYGRYLNGNWQWLRFAVGAVVIALLVTTSFTALGMALAVRLDQPTPELVISGEILLFVVVMEGWIWIKRAQVKNGLRLLREIREAYRLIHL